MPDILKRKAGDPGCLGRKDGECVAGRKRVEDVMAILVASEEQRSRTADFAAKRWSWDTSCMMYADIIRALAAEKRRASLA